MLRIAVIGSGATAVSIVEAALGSSIDIEVGVFDPWVELPEFEQSKANATAAQLAKKSRFGSLVMYEYPAKHVSVNKDLHVPLSGTVGGLTSVWGANSTVPEFCDLETYSKEFTQESIDWVKEYATITNLGEIRDDSYFYISERFRFLLASASNKNDIHINPALLSFNRKKCTSIGGCLNGCTQNAIFSADERVQELVLNKNVKLNKSFVKSVIPLDNGKFSLEIESGKNLVTNSISYDKVFIACGAIASCALLQRSNLLPGEVQLHDTQAYYSAFYIRKSKAQSKINFELAQIFIRKHQELHISLYEYSSQFLERARLILGSAVNLIPKYVWNHVVAGIGFIDSSNSGLLTLSHSNSISTITQVTNIRSRKKIQNLMKMVRKQLRGTGIFHIPFLNQIPNVGASYHIGAACYQDKPLFTAEGKLTSEENLELYVFDSASLKSLPVGPITTTVMASAYGRTKLALKNE